MLIYTFLIFVCLFKIYIQVSCTIGIIQEVVSAKKMYFVVLAAVPLEAICSCVSRAEQPYSPRWQQLPRMWPQSGPKHLKALQLAVT